MSLSTGSPGSPLRLTPSVHFDGNGHDDLVAAVPLRWVNGLFASGAVHALYDFYGTGLSSFGNHLITQDSSNLLEMGEDEDGFGAAVASR